MGYTRRIWRCPVLKMFMSNRPLSTLALLIALPFALFTMPAEADILYTGASSGANRRS